ncbi:MAG: transcription elongation factor GreA [Pirellulales bacterium]
MSEYVPMTRDGYNRLKAQIEQLELVEMPKIAEKIADARAERPPRKTPNTIRSANQGMMQARINALKNKLANAHIIDASQISKDQIAFGATVRVMDLDFQDEEEYTLVGMGDEDYDVGKILSAKSIGGALMGKKVGQVVEIQCHRELASLRDSDNRVSRY